MPLNGVSLFIFVWRTGVKVFLFLGLHNPPQNFVLFRTLANVVFVAGRGGDGVDGRRVTERFVLRHKSTRRHLSHHEARI